MKTSRQTGRAGSRILLALSHKLWSTYDKKTGSGIARHQHADILTPDLRMYLQGSRTGEGQFSEVHSAMPI